MTKNHHYGNVAGAWRSARARNDRGSWLIASALASLTVACGFVGSARAATGHKVLFSFLNERGAVPEASLVADGAGNLYGTTIEGGLNNDGVVFELSPPAVGKTAWTQTVLVSFDGTDGQAPRAGLIVDGADNLYGTTSIGGKYQHGVVFKLAPPAEGKTAWTETVLHSFKGKASGEGPTGSLIMDGAGNLFGASIGAGANDYGLVFELSPPAAGKTVWTKTTLFTFNGTDGAYPTGGLIADGAGNLYGTTLKGGGTNGNYDDGVVYELSPPAPGQTIWTEKVLQAFNGQAPTGAFPQATLVLDRTGNLYGAASGGRGEGLVFELSPPGAGQTAWSETVLVSFEISGANGNGPDGGLIADSAGNLYGTTEDGGGSDQCPNVQGCGVVFEASPPAAGKKAWTERVLHRFNLVDGAHPEAGLIADNAGNLYGTAANGGAHGDGVVFNLNP
jgi:uncharacterized repeat protein (TIGR03803 family)